METLYEGIHLGRVWHTSSYQAPIDTVRANSIKRVSQVENQKLQVSLEEELWGYYVTESSSKSRKQIIRFLRNPDKIRNVDEFALCEVRNGYNGQANAGDQTVGEINKLINEELERRSNQSNVLIKR